MTIELTTATQAQKTGILSSIGGGVARFLPRRNMVISMVGDSNTDDISGRPGWQYAVDNEWKSPGGVFEGCTIYNNGANGSTLAGWAASIVSKVGDARNATNRGTGNPWDAVSANPDIVMIKLGTNDRNSPSARATNTESVMRANYLALVNHFLKETSAIVWLCLPQPYHWGETTDPFDYLTLFTDDADAAANSVLLRTLHTEWIGKHPRVMVYDSHEHLFGFSCADKTTNCLDPETSGQMIFDGLHPTNLGFRRYAQQMAEQWSGVARPFSLRTVPTTQIQTAKWSADFYLSGNATATQINLYMNPELIATRVGSTATNPGTEGANIETSPSSRQSVADMKILQDAIPSTIYQQLLACSGTLNLYFHNTGNSYTLNKFTLSAIVTAATPNYVTLILTGINSSPSGENGRCTVWVSDQESMPFNGSRRHEDIHIDMATGSGAGVSIPLTDPTLSLLDEINWVTCARAGTGAIVFELRACNQDDGRWVLGGDTTYGTSAGKPLAEFQFANGSFRPTRIIMRRDLWISQGGFIINSVGVGGYLRLQVKNGTNNGNCHVQASRRGSSVWPVVTLNPADTSAVAGADAVFTMTFTGGTGAVQWQQSTDAGVTWTDISGATSTTYTRTAVVTGAVPGGDSGLKIRCLVKYNEIGFSSDIRFITTNEVTLTVT